MRRPFGQILLMLAVVVLLAHGASSQLAAEDAADWEKTASDVKRDGDGHVIEVSFRGTEADDAALAPLAALPKLRSVLLNDTKITDAGFKTLGSISTLQNIDARGCPVGNEGVRHLTGLKELRALRLNGQSGATTVDDEAMADVAKLKSLKALMLDYLWISEEGLAKVTKLDNLEELYLAQTLVGDDALAVIKQMPRLKKLRISKSAVSSAGLKHLVEVPALVELDISEDSQIFDEGMKHVGELKNLEKLNLWRVALTDEGVAHLAGLTNLKWLNLDNTQLSDAGLKHLAGMKKLEFLHIGSTAITDAGLEHLAGLESLKDLSVTRTAVTEQGAAALQEKLPNVKIQIKYVDGE